MYPNLLVVTIDRKPAETLIHLTINLEGMVCTRRHHNLESLKQALVEAVDNFSMDVVCTAMDKWPNRPQRGTRGNSGHFEHMFCSL